MMNLFQKKGSAARGWMSVLLTGMCFFGWSTVADRRSRVRHGFRRQVVSKAPLPPRGRSRRQPLP